MVWPPWGAVSIGVNAAVAAKDITVSAIAKTTFMVRPFSPGAAGAARFGKEPLAALVGPDARLLWKGFGNDAA